MARKVKTGQRASDDTADSPSTEGTLRDRALEAATASKAIKSAKVVKSVRGQGNIQQRQSERKGDENTTEATSIFGPHDPVHMQESFIGEANVPLPTAPKRKRTLSVSAVTSPLGDSYSISGRKEVRDTKKAKKNILKTSRDEAEKSDAGFRVEQNKKTRFTADEAKDSKASAKQPAKKATEGKKKWREDWKLWLEEHKTSAQFPRTYNEDLVNVKESSKVYGVNAEDLATLPHCPVTNPHVPAFTPSKFFKQDDVETLAFRKEAILSGISQYDETELLAKGRDIYEVRVGPIDELFDKRMPGLKRAMDRY